MSKYLLILAMVLSFFWCGSAIADDNNFEIVGSVGYHIWTQSGHTFARSDKGDKEWNGWAAQVEATYWWDWVGWYAYGGKDKQIREKMFTNPDRYFKANVYYIGSGIKLRRYFYPWLAGYLGTGVNYTVSKQKYSMQDGSDWHDSETLDNVGPDVLAGVEFQHESGWLASLSGRYSWNREMSNTFNQTTFDPGGLRLWLGVGYMF